LPVPFSVGSAAVGVNGSLSSGKSATLPAGLGSGFAPASPNTPGCPVPLPFVAAGSLRRSVPSGAAAPPASAWAGAGGSTGAVRMGSRRGSVGSGINIGLRLRLMTGKGGPP